MQCARGYLLWHDEGLKVTTVPDVDRTDQFEVWRLEDPAWTPQLFVRPYRSGGPTVIDDTCTRGSPNVVSEHWDDGSAKARWQVYEVTDCR